MLKQLFFYRKDTKDMSYQLSEQKVLKQLGIEDFRHLTKAKVINLASMLDKMDPEVAKKALEQFPEFSSTIKEMLIEFKNILDKGIASNNESTKAVYNTYNEIIASLQKLLENDNLSFEERKYIIEQMKEIADKIDKKDSENKKWIACMLALAGGVIFGIAAHLASALGTNTNANLIDSDENDNNE